MAAQLPDPSHMAEIEKDRMSCHIMDVELAQDIVNDVEYRHEEGLKIMLLDSS